VAILGWLAFVAVVGLGVYTVARLIRSHVRVATDDHQRWTPDGLGENDGPPRDE
jgi:hypothetical protein